VTAGNLTMTAGDFSFTAGTGTVNYDTNAAATVANLSYSTVEIPAAPSRPCQPQCSPGQSIGPDSANIAMTGAPALTFGNFTYASSATSTLKNNLVVTNNFTQTGEHAQFLSQHLFRGGTTSIGANCTVKSTTAVTLSRGPLPIRTITSTTGAINFGAGGLTNTAISRRPPRAI